MRIRFSRRHQPAFTLVELLIVVVIIGLLAVIAISNYALARDSFRLNSIYSNLRRLDTAKTMWALEQGRRVGEDVADVSVLSDYLRGGRIRDVVNETYIPNPVGEAPEAALPEDVSLGPYAAGALIPAP